MLIIFTNSQFTPLLSVAKCDLSWLNNLFMARFQLITMSSYTKNKLQMCSVTQRQCRRRQMCGKLSQFTQSTHILCVRKNDLSSLSNIFMARFQLITMSSYAKNKLHLCSVTQHQRCRRQRCGKFSQIHPVHSLFVCYKKITYLYRTIY